jgi:hypothetical protein
MKYLQTFSLFESRTPGTLTKEQEEFLDQYTRVTWLVNPATGLVDVQGSFLCSKQRLKSMYGIRFGTVTGHFSCYNNQLTSLEGAPQTVEGSFSCAGNQLTILEGAPQTVGYDFYCDRNQLTILAGAPLTVEGSFNCAYNQLTTLEGAPQTVEGDFYCSRNQLTTLVGAPQKVGGDFFCYHNQLTTLEGAPRTVEGGFGCYDFRLEPGKWNLAGWLEVLQTGSQKAQMLIQTTIGADWWNSEISDNPIGTLLRLAAVWDGLPEQTKREIKIPSGLQDDFDNFLDLERAGVY